MAFGMWMVRAKMWACTGFTWDPGASYFSVFSLDGAVNGILRFVLGYLEVHMHGRCLVVSCTSGTQHPPTGQTSILTVAAQGEFAAGVGPVLAWKALGRPAMAAFTAAVAIVTAERGWEEGGHEDLEVPHEMKLKGRCSCQPRPARSCTSWSPSTSSSGTPTPPGPPGAPWPSRPMGTRRLRPGCPLAPPPVGGRPSALGP